MVGVPVRFDAPSAGHGGNQVAITWPTQDALLIDIEARLAKQQGFTIATLNLDHIVKLDRDTAFRAAYLAHSHVVADGNPVVWLSRLAGRKVDLVPGSELVVPLARVAARLQVPVALLGSTADVLASAGARLQETAPGLRIAARIAPPMGFDALTDWGAIDALRASGAGLCFLALGAPKQEIFAARAAHALPGCGFVSVGAGLDFIAGTQHRAPRWVRRIAMEWLWRMATNPRRLARRYWDCGVLLPRLALTAWGQRRAGS